MEARVPARKGVMDKVAGDRRGTFARVVDRLRDWKESGHCERKASYDFLCLCSG